MAFLSYNGVPIRICKTLEFHTEPDQTEDGTDWQMTRTRITVQGVLGAMATTVPGGPVLVAGIPGFQGRLGQSMQELQQLLMMPRQKLVYSLVAIDVAGAAPAGSDVVLSVPAGDALCDAGNGPFPRFVKVHEISGDYSAFITFSVECFAVASKALVLANRWQAQHSIDDDQYTTATYRGHAYFSSNLLALGGDPRAIQPDDLRDVLIPPVDRLLQRRAVSVVITPDGRQLMYEVRDVQQNLCIPQGWPATRIEGLVTTGSESPMRNIQDFISTAGAVAKDGWNGDYLSGMGKILKSTVPVCKANAVIRVYGRPDANKSDLANIASWVALDRLAPVGGIFNAIGQLYIVSAYITASIEKKFVELRIEAMPGVQATLRQFFQPFAFTTMQKLDGDINVGGLNLPYDRGFVNSPLLSNNTRGPYLDTLVSQLLGIPNRPPAVPTLPPNATDLPME